MREEPRRPQYKLKYLQCIHDKQHEGEIMNFVCLNPGCAGNSLICSMCRNDKHKGHQAKPLKFYLSELKKQFDSNERDYNHQLQELEEVRSSFLLKLKETVENIAEQFQKFEEEAVRKFQQVRKYILEQQSKKNKFNDFYLSLLQQTSESPIFLIQDYLPKTQEATPSDLTKLEKLQKQVCDEINFTRQSFISDVKKEKKISEKSFDKIAKLSKTVKVNGNLYSQTNFTNLAQTMNMFELNIKNELQKGGKIKLKVTKIKKGGIITFGAITKNLFNSFNWKTPPSWNSAVHNQELFYYNNHGSVFGQIKNQLKTFSEGSSMQLSMKDSNTMKIIMKKHSAQFKLPSGKDFFFFFNLQGNCELQIIHQVKN